MTYVKKLMGERCYLAPIEVEDAARYVEWFNDLEVAQYLSMLASPLTNVREEELLQNMAAEGVHIFGIVDAQEDTLIGNCGLVELDHINRTGDVGILIGDKRCWNRGYGREAMGLLLDYGFNILNLHNLQLKVYGNNHRAIACYRSVGFKDIGLRREARVLAGTAFDILYMDMLDREYESVYVKKIVEPKPEVKGR